MNTSKILKLARSFRKISQEVSGQQVDYQLFVGPMLGIEGDSNGISFTFNQDHPFIKDMITAVQKAGASDFRGDMIFNTDGTVQMKSNVPAATQVMNSKWKPKLDKAIQAAIKSGKLGVLAEPGAWDNFVNFSFD